MSILMGFANGMILPILPSFMGIVWLSSAAIQKVNDLMGVGILVKIPVCYIQS